MELLAELLVQALLAMPEVQPTALQERLAPFVMAPPQKNSALQHPKQARKKTRRFENSFDSRRAHFSNNICHVEQHTKSLRHSVLLECIPLLKRDGHWAVPSCIAITTLIWPIA